MLEQLRKLWRPRSINPTPSTEVCPAKELAEVFRDYCQEVWIEALNLVRVPATLEWRKFKNIYYPPNICKTPAALIGTRANAALVPTASE